MNREYAEQIADLYGNSCEIAGFMLKNPEAVLQLQKEHPQVLFAINEKLQRDYLLGEAVADMLKAEKLTKDTSES